MRNILITIFILAFCSCKTETKPELSNAPKTYEHYSHILLKNVKKGQPLTRDLIGKGFPMVYSVKAKDDSSADSEISKMKSWEPIIDDEINDYIGRKFKKAYNPNGDMLDITKDMFEPTEQK